MIAILSKETIDKIAAGEVVERPLSIVKELVENSIDAGATAITVETKNGGKDLIRVTDNGSGIAKEECELAFTRHSTSKINSSEDLTRLSTLGFRGEALSSIAAVSKTELITKTSNSTFATRFVIEGGKQTSIEDIAAPDGSTFFVRDLFYNTPVRKKFLKSNNSENAAIEEVIEHLALSCPHISFRLVCEGKEKVYTGGNGNLNNTILEIFGLNTANSLLDIESANELFSVSGFIGKPALGRGSRLGEYFFVNGRFVKSKTLESACEDAYAGILMQHQFPFLVLNLRFPDGSLDVNVHPSKMEVRFDNPLEIQMALKEIIHNRLIKREDIERISLEDEKKETKVVSEQISFEPFEQKAKSETYKPSKIAEDEFIRPQIESDNIVNDTKPEEAHNYSFISAPARKDHRIIGQIFGTYWLIEYDNSLYVLDQHAAHEKVLFEKTMKMVSQNTMTSQLIAPPILISLSATEEQTLESNMDSYKTLGYAIEHFGGRDYKITGIPASLPNVDPKELLIETLSKNVTVNTSKITERVASISCKAAVKGNHNMSEQEIGALLDELLTLENPYHCPHGRPTMISFTRYELDKKFKRIV